MHHAESTTTTTSNSYRRTLKINRDPALSQAERSANLSACHQRCADRTLRVLRANGSIFIKLGQHLSSMNYLLPPQWTTTFIPLQDQCPMSSYESIARMFERDTGHSVDDIFMEFDRLPIGAASLAQVHLARLKGDGRKVAVKVQHPALEEWVPLDLGLTRFTFATLKNWFPEYDLEWLSQEMDTSLPQELDFEREAGNAQRTAAYFETKDLPLIIPGGRRFAVYLFRLLPEPWQSSSSALADPFIVQLYPPANAYLSWNTPRAVESTTFLTLTPTASPATTYPLRLLTSSTP